MHEDIYRLLFFFNRANKTLLLLMGFIIQAMWLANLVCVGMIRAWADAGVMTLGKIWWALAVSTIALLNFLSDAHFQFDNLTLRARKYLLLHIARLSWVHRLSLASFDSNLRPGFGRYCKEKTARRRLTLRILVKSDSIIFPVVHLPYC